MSRNIDDMMACFEFACLRTKNGLMSRFFYENWEFKLHKKARKLFNFLDYLHKKLNASNERLAVIAESDTYHLKQIIESKIEGVQYHNISHHQARTLYESYDSQYGFWS